MGDMIAPMPYPAIYSLTEEAGQPIADASRSAFLDDLDDAAIEGFIEGIRSSTADLTLIQMRVLGGAMGRVAPDATAFAHRSARIMTVMVAASADRAEVPANEAWAVRMHDLVAARSTGVYVNFLHREGPARIRQAYPGATYERLLALKRRWDPTNLFRHNQNIAP
jgi:FAD/FMN-containing dehydrogenase